MPQEPFDLGKVISNGFAIAIVLFALFMVFGGGLLNGFVDLMHALGAK